TVVVLSCDVHKGIVELYDPDSPLPENKYSISQFTDAWNDSSNYMVTADSKDMKDYVPSPIDLSDVELTEDLNELKEAIAENAHEVWAENRQAEGWTYGPQRDDRLKQTPDMVPYAQLPETEKAYDREMAMKTIKLLKKLGYDIIKREETELYDVLKLRLKESAHEFRCRRCGNVIYRNQVFCDRCGLELNMDWKEK
ncbi:MAG: RyR domain-containing protein, partial [Clostridium sp.]|nr:RyR domain-containing protein [Clostridium sp.]